MSTGIGDISGMNSISQFNQIFKQDISNMTNNMNNSLSLEGINPSDVLSGKVSVNSEGQKLTNDKELTSDLKELMSNSTGGSAAQVAHDFSHALNNSLNDLNQSQRDATDAMETFASGGNIDVHSVMIAAEKASLNMNMALQLRNKFVKAYQDISNIHV